MSKRTKKDKRPVAKIDFKPYGAAIKAGRTKQKESRNKAADALFISPRYLANIENKGQHPTQRIGAYLRKMAIDGYIIYTDTADIKAFTKELSAIGRNINQIAKRINAGGPAYQADMDEIRERLDEIWQLQRHILSSQR